MLAFHPLSPQTACKGRRFVPIPVQLNRNVLGIQSPRADDMTDTKQAKDRTRICYKLHRPLGVCVQLEHMYGNTYPKQRVHIPFKWKKSVFT